DAERVIEHEASGADFSGVSIHQTQKITHRRPPLWLGEAFYGGLGHERAGGGPEQAAHAGYGKSRRSAAQSRRSALARAFRPGFWTGRCILTTAATQWKGLLLDLLRRTVVQRAGCTGEAPAHHPGARPACLTTKVAALIAVSFCPASVAR